MRKLGIKIAVFGIVFIVLIKVMGGLDNIDRETSTNPNIIRIANAHSFDSLDILFVGSSASYSGINPGYFDSIGLRTYNLSIAAAGPYFYELLINDYVSSIKQKPKTVFILVMPNTFSEKVDDFYEIGVHRYLENSVSNEKIVQMYPDWKTYPYLLVKSFQKGVRNVLSRQKASPATIRQEINDKGFYRSDEQTSSEKEKKEFLVHRGDKQLRFKNNKLDYLEQVARTLKTRGIEIVFFSLPGNKANSFFNSEYMSDYRAAEFKLKAGWKFLDISSLQMDSSCYRNVDHINTKGASIVSARLVNEIFGDKDLVDIFHLANPGRNKLSGVNHE